MKVRCGGSGELVEELTPQFDHRDPRYKTREFECPGCPDCVPCSAEVDDEPGACWGCGDLVEPGEIYCYSCASCLQCGERWCCEDTHGP